jgi:phosphate transport system substrate-binding protein
MKHTRQAGIALLAGTMLGLAGSARAQDKIVTADGSSTVEPITEAVAEDFQAARQGIHVTVGTSGTGGGFKKFVRGEIDSSDASRPISVEEMKAAKEAGIEYIELPICFDALTVVVSPQNTWCDTITVAELAKIWGPDADGKILTWNQVRPEWPNEKLALFGPGTDSGTFDYFTEAIVGKKGASRTDYTASEDDNVIVRGIEGTKSALGYVGVAYVAASGGKLKSLKMDWDKDQIEGVAPSAENVLKGIYNPLSRPLFIYVNKKSAETKPYVKEFVQFYLEHVKELSAEVKYIPLPDKAYAQVKERFAKLQVGTGFEGHPAIGLKVEDILSRPLGTEIKASEAGAKKEGK